MDVSTHMRTRVRAGESSAFAELFDDYARAVYNHAFRLTADWSTAEDVMATTFMEAWRLRDRVDPEGGSLRPWLLGIATNTARNQHRSNRRYRAAAALPRRPSCPCPTTPTRSPTGSTTGGASRPPSPPSPHCADPREVVALCLGEGLEYEAAAEALGIPVGTVASRLSRARRKLRALAADEPARLPTADRTPEEVREKKVRGNREGGRTGRQVRGDHANVVRPAQGGNR